MKKIIIVLMLLIAPVVAFGANNLQQEDENLIRGVVNSPIGRLSRHHASWKMDYISAKLNKGQTVYSQIVALENKYSGTGVQNKEINQKYIKQLKDFYMFVASYPDEESMKGEFLQEFESERIVVPDEEYKLLDKDLKVLLSVVNVFN